jgi:hypothetical protein
MNTETFWRLAMEDIAVHASAVVSTLAGGVLALVGTLSGVWLANRNNRRIANDTRDHSDRTRFHERKAEIYPALMEAFEEWWKLLRQWTTLPSDQAKSANEKARSDELLKAASLITHVQSFGKEEVWSCAVRALSQMYLLDLMTYNCAKEEIEEKMKRLPAPITELQEAIRSDLRS